MDQARGHYTIFCVPNRRHILPMSTRLNGDRLPSSARHFTAAAMVERTPLQKPAMQTCSVCLADIRISGCALWFTVEWNLAAPFRWNDRIEVYAVTVGV